MKKKIQIVMLALAALGMVACGGGGPSQEDACGCLDATQGPICDLAWEVCDEAGGSDGKDCKESLQTTFCP